MIRKGVDGKGMSDGKERAMKVNNNNNTNLAIVMQRVVLDP